MLTARGRAVLQALLANAGIKLALGHQGEHTPHMSLAGGDCRSVAGEIAASQKIEPVSLSRPAASERLATSISLAVGRRQRSAAGYETGLTGVPRP